MREASFVILNELNGGRVGTIGSAQLFTVAAQKSWFEDDFRAYLRCGILAQG